MDSITVNTDGVTIVEGTRSHAALVNIWKQIEEMANLAAESTDLGLQSVVADIISMKLSITNMSFDLFINSALDQKRDEGGQQLALDFATRMDDKREGMADMLRQRMDDLGILEL